MQRGQRLGHNSEVPGRLIAVEGLDGSGKSTQIALLLRWLQLESHKVFFTEWNSSTIVKTATRKGKKKKLLTPSTFSLIHCVDFADRYERQILPLLKAGYIVLADRYIYTAFARDVVRGCDRDWVHKLYSYARPPDITFFFDVPLDTALDRILSGRPQLKFHEAGMDLDLSPDIVESFKIFQSYIYAEYQRLKGEYGFVVVNGGSAPTAQQRQIRKIVKERIDLGAYKLRTFER